jgi:intracellular sulfur oxidation DsrE/DsrF family protein
VAWDEKMKRLFVLLLAVAVLAALVYQLQSHEPGQAETTADVVDDSSPPPPSADTPQPETAPGRAVLDISVHTLEELQVLFERAGELAMKPRPSGEEASIVLVLHGPEVDFFSIRNYDTYKDIVDEAARLDAFEVMDIRICQTMMEMRGIESDDIPSFIEQVPYGPGEIERLAEEGYVYF